MLRFGKNLVEITGFQKSRVGRKALHFQHLYTSV
jgi:hypothetical protein